MAIRPILAYPDAAPILTAVSSAVALNDAQLAEIVCDLEDTLLATPNGVGLAAPQIGYLKRVFVLKKHYILHDLVKDSFCAAFPGEIIPFINPKIITAKGSVHEEEGCLSVPNTYIPIQRARVVKLRAVTPAGDQIYERFEGLAARAVQQEIDHLNGILIIAHQQKGGKA
ncbi:MAG: peptide deformylase [Candidatus Omnitrophica bacterium]|nr:peptide deformylase [Candidatus Omnitrophota bacterium]